MNEKTIINSADAIDKELDRIVKDAEKILLKAIKKLESRIMADFADLKKSKKGNLLGPKVNLKQAQGLHKQLIKHFEEMYGDGLYMASKGFAQVARMIQDNWPDLDEAIEFTGIDKTVLKTLENQAVKEFKQFGVQAQEKIAKAMYDHVVSQSSFSSLVNTMAGILGTAVDKRGNNMAKYAKLWANDAVMNFHQAVTLEKARQAGLKSFLFYGNIITTSRKFCIERAGKVFTKKEIEAWNDMSWAGKSGPPLLYRGGWNCRHHWLPVKKAWIPDGQIKVQNALNE
jgi:hypothetical protein